MAPSLRSSASALGSRGGRAGVGGSKRRGDSAYDRRLAAQRRDRAGASAPMRHRHLNHMKLTPAAIDDIISNGKLSDWERLRRSARQDSRVRDRIRRVCNARERDPSAQRHHFWRHYAQGIREAP